ncbi:MAG: hypothetical protein K6T83_24065 [Alicyclobacillus sp.]|nr:hypothetical protein [Alicyclobacillus sp.]
MSIRKMVRRFLGHRVQCHTMYGTFHGVIIHCTKHHVILAPIPRIFHDPTWTHYDASYPHRQYPMGMGPGPGPGPGPGGPGWGGGWHMAIPLAAILGITALGMHWW